jgi:hypothetical protein
VRSFDTHHFCIGENCAQAERGCTGTTAEIQQALAPKTRCANIGQKLFFKNPLYILRIVVPGQRIAEPDEGRFEKSRDYIEREGSLATGAGDEGMSVVWFHRDFELAARKQEDLPGSFGGCENREIIVDVGTTRPARIWEHGHCRL